MVAVGVVAVAAVAAAAVAAEGAGVGRGEGGAGHSLGSSIEFVELAEYLNSFCVRRNRLQVTL